MAQLLEGKGAADSINAELRADVQRIRLNYSRVPVLASVQVGEDPASAVYLRWQSKAAENLGIEYRQESFSADIPQDDLLELISGLNNDPRISGIIIQRPLPAHLDAVTMNSAVMPLKDVEGMHPENLGRIISRAPLVVPPTAAAIMELLKSTKIELYGKEAVIVGHSMIVGKPLALLFLNQFLTTTVCHIATSQRGDLKSHVARAEIVVAACGVPRLLPGDWIKENAVVIDVGINNVGGKIVGDVDFDSACLRASFLTPVPGGVGPLTVAMLMRNVVDAFVRQQTDC